MWTSCEQHLGGLNTNSTSSYAILVIKWVGQVCVCVRIHMCLCVYVY